ncbi:amidohydrolase family protein [Streptomyces sp. NPDC096311]|uniref:amidohydrolase family protein n=1 Tax=Streptomyces sp. NPDC096311 TaxID=3366083 RepID=UPI0038077647
MELPGGERADVAVSQTGADPGPAGADGLTPGTSAGGRIAAVTAVGTLRARRGDQEVDGHGGALLPGLADRHLHLLAMAAARASVNCGPPEVNSPRALSHALRGMARTTSGSWVRGVGYHESVAGELDRDALDALAPDVPVRLQHASGALWMLSGTAVRRLGLDGPDVALPAGAECDHDGRFTGRLWREDIWLRQRLGLTAEPDLGAVGRQLAAYGITSVRDATPDLDEGAVRLLTRAGAEGRVPQRITLLGVPTAAVPPGCRITVGARKLLLPDHDLWEWGDFLERIRAAREDSGRPVAVHCVTREALILTLAVLREVGTVPGDTIEHAAVVPPELRVSLRELGLRVITQPAFVAERGDRYLREVDPDDLPWLYPYASLVRAGVPVAAASDAPYGTADPWAVLRAARDRSTGSGRVLGAEERVGVRRALADMLSAPRVEPGAPADLCLLRTGLRAAIAAPDARAVRMTLCDGRVVHGGQAG